MTLNAELARRAARLTFPMWVVYERPTDFPDGYLARLWEAFPGPPAPTSSAITGELEAIRQGLEECGFTRLERQLGDEPQILEVWL